MKIYILNKPYRKWHFDSFFHFTEKYLHLNRACLSSEKSYLHLKNTRIYTICHWIGLRASDIAWFIVVTDKHIWCSNDPFDNLHAGWQYGRGLLVTAHKTSNYLKKHYMVVMLTLCNDFTLLCHIYCRGFSPNMTQDWFPVVWVNCDGCYM